MMKKKLIILCFLLATIHCAFAKGSNKQAVNSTELKPRIVVLTDVSTWETDDSESLVRLMAHADLFEIEGLVYTTGYSLEQTRDDFFQLIHDAIDAYEKDVHNLMKRSNQNEFSTDEARQNIGYWPSPDYLRERTVFGSRKRGMEYIGEDNVSDGSELIIKLADEDDDRPLWVLLWGGGNTMAQAIWQVQQERIEAELKAFLHKIPTYAITDQDRSYKEGTPYDGSSHQWMRREFKNDLMFLWDECAWKKQNGMGRDNWDKYEEHIQSHGALGKVYPKYKFGVEGDSPSFYYVLPNGLGNPLEPGQINWGGYFEWGKGPDNETFAYTNYEGDAWETCSRYFEYFYPAIFNNFVARMDWAEKGAGNCNPVVIVNGEKGYAPIEIKKKGGRRITLNASKSFDPDGDQLNYKWWFLPEAGTYNGEFSIPDNRSEKVTFTTPSGSSGKTIHLICEVSDNGKPSLTSYRRIIVKIN